MNHLFRIFIITLLLAGFVLVDNLFADDKKTKEVCVPTDCVNKDAKTFTITGMNYCVSCGLKEAHGAASNCKTYGHQHALSVKKLMTPCGKDKSDCAGMTLYYLANEKSKELLDGHQMDTVKIMGKVYWKQNMIEVVEYEMVKEE